MLFQRLRGGLIEGRDVTVGIEWKFATVLGDPEQRLVPLKC